MSDRPANQPIHQPTDRLTNQLSDRLTNQPTNLPTKTKYLKLCFFIGFYQQLFYLHCSFPKKIGRYVKCIITFFFSLSLTNNYILFRRLHFFKRVPISVLTTDNYIPHAPLQCLQLTITFHMLHYSAYNWQLHSTCCSGDGFCYKKLKTLREKVKMQSFSIFSLFPIALIKVSLLVVILKDETAL